MNPSHLSALLNVAARAIEVTDAEQSRALAKVALNDAYRDWKRRNQVGHVDADTDDWARMMASTKPAYSRLEKAKRDERNALRRLATAVRRYKEAGND